MGLNGQFVFGDRWIAYDGATTGNRLHAHAAFQVVTGSPAARRDGPLLLLAAAVRLDSPFR